MRATKIEFYGNRLIFTVADGTEAANLYMELVNAGDLEVTVKKFRKKRSLDANAMAWKLIGELSAVLRISPTEIYRSYIKDVGGDYEIVPVRKDRINAWTHIWCDGHIGRMCEDMGECRKIPNYHYIKCFIASSDFDTAQMSRLLDLITYDCKENGIQILTETERNLLLIDWERGKP